jgi:hypothetical protein
VFSDVDILVPFGKLPDVENALMLHGWSTTYHNPTTSGTTASGCTSCRRFGTIPAGRCSMSTTRSCPHRAPQADSAKLLAASRPSGARSLRVLCPPT